MREERVVSSGWTSSRTALKEVEPDVQGTFSAREKLPDSLSSSSSPANAPRLDSFAFADMTGVNGLVRRRPPSRWQTSRASERKVDDEEQQTRRRATALGITSEQTHLDQGTTRRPPSGPRPDSGL